MSPRRARTPRHSATAPAIRATRHSVAVPTGQASLHKQTPRYWTKDEHRLFISSFNKFSNFDLHEDLDNWSSIDMAHVSRLVRTRDTRQCRTHYQKWVQRLQKEKEQMNCPSDKQGQRFASLLVAVNEVARTDAME
jgi:Myb-like DNA-binding domain